jgi:hypothetical protein
VVEKEGKSVLEFPKTETISRYDANVDMWRARVTVTPSKETEIG